MKFTNLDLLEKADKFLIEVSSYEIGKETNFDARCYFGHDEIASLTDVYSEGMKVCVGNMMIEAAKQLAIRLGLNLIVNGEYEKGDHLLRIFEGKLKLIIKRRNKMKKTKDYQENEARLKLLHNIILKKWENLTKFQKIKVISKYNDCDVDRGNNIDLNEAIRISEEPSYKLLITERDGWEEVRETCGVLNINHIQIAMALL